MLKPLPSYPIGIKVKGTRLTPTSKTKLPKEKGGNNALVCRCECGGRIIVSFSNLRIGRVKSCGCIIPDHSKPHTLAQSKRSFFRKVNRGNHNSCWEWMGGKNRDGYGTAVFLSRHYGAHRASWMIHNGPIPKKMSVLHRCDNPGCVNPDHLWLGTQADNVRDCKAKGRIRHKLSPIDIVAIRELIHSGMTHGRIADGFGVCRQLISRIKCKMSQEITV